MSLLWEKLMRPAMFAFDAERAHEIGMKALELGLASPFYVDDPTFGLPAVERFGLSFKNPVGVAAGFDKNGVVVDQLASLGFGFIEVGTVTFQPQPGNPRPRLFRLPADRAIINRLGFNNDGAVRVAARLEKIDRRCVVGVNIGRNKDVGNDEAVQNYLSCFDIVQPVANYITVNVSSPNTPELRKLQASDALEQLLSALQGRNQQIGPKPLLVKIAPDLTEGEIESVVKVAIANGIDGLVATNTTLSRDGLSTTEPERFGAGGLSGAPLRDAANRVVSTVFRCSDGKLPIIGVGGVFNAEDAFEKIAAGASVIQAYTGFVYSGPDMAKRIGTGLAAMLAKRGFASLDQIVGSGQQRV